MTKVGLECKGLHLVEDRDAFGRNERPKRWQTCALIDGEEGKA